MDIETIEYNGNQIPIAISTYFNNKSYLFLIDQYLLKTDSDLAINNLWKSYFDNLYNLKIFQLFLYII